MIFDKLPSILKNAVKTQLKHTMLNPAMDDLHAFSSIEDVQEDVQEALMLMTTDDSYYACFDKSVECQLFRFRSYVNQLYGTQSLLHFIVLILMCSFTLYGENVVPRMTEEKDRLTLFVMQLVLMTVRIWLDCIISVKPIFNASRILQMLISLQSFAYSVYIYSDDATFIILNLLICGCYVPLTYVVLKMYKLLKQSVVKIKQLYTCTEHINEYAEECTNCCCCICLEPMHQRYVTQFPCSHCTHDECFIDFAKLKSNTYSTCPVCRQPWILTS